MKFIISAASDPGCVRSNNEDMILVRDEFIRNSSIKTNADVGNTAMLLAVSDGMGGHAAGELASEFTLQRINAIVGNLPDNGDNSSLQGFLNDQIHLIHQSLNRLGIDNPELRGLGCTFTGLLVHQHRLYSIHIGDSRLYRVRLGVMAQLTKDHSLRNMLNDPSIPANKIANSFGGGAANLFFDFEELTDRLLANDRLLLCSDGLNGELTDDEMEEAIVQGAEAPELIEMARVKGGRDNISAIIITIE